MGTTHHEPTRRRLVGGARRSRRAWLAGSALLATSVVGFADPVYGHGGGGMVVAAAATTARRTRTSPIGMPSARRRSPRRP